MVAAQILPGVLVGVMGLVQAPGNEAGAPGVVAAAVAQTQVTHVVAEFNIVVAAGGGTGEVAVGVAFLIAQLAQGDGNQIRPTVAGDGDSLVVFIVAAAGVGVGRP